MTQLKLYTDVGAYYEALLSALRAARQHIYMAYYAYDDGHIARRINQVLARKAAAGVAVNLLVDEAGLYLDNPINGRRNRQLIHELRASGAQVTLFRPHGRLFSIAGRLHCKFCAVDNRWAFIGGSNIGDHYLGWRDTNLRIEGPLGDGFARLHAVLRAFGSRSEMAACPGELTVAGMPLRLTVPGQRQDVHRALLTLISKAQTAVALRSWYFLPDKEIAAALVNRAEQGVSVTILCSQKTRLPLLDIASRRLCRRLSQAGVKVYRYSRRYMHAKEAWNDQGDILIGSANIDHWSLQRMFECSLQIRDQALARQLTRVLIAEKVHCETVESAPVPGPLWPRPA